MMDASLPTPAALTDFETLFPDEAACRAWLTERRWPDGFRCPACGHDAAWSRGTDRLLCRRCRHETSVTAGTVLHRSHLPLRVWFLAAYLVATTPGINSVTLATLLRLRSRKTAWTLLDRLRSSMSALALPPLDGVVEVATMPLGDFAPGRRSDTDAEPVADATIVLVALERDSGRTRLVEIPDRAGSTFVPLLAHLVAPSSEIVTAGRGGYRELLATGFRWTPVPSPRGGQPPGNLNRAMPAVDEVTSRFRHWLLGTYNKPPGDLGPYLDEFCFRSEFGGDPHAAFETLLGLAVRAGRP